MHVIPLALDCPIFFRNASLGLHDGYDTVLDRAKCQLAQWSTEANGEYFHSLTGQESKQHTEAATVISGHGPATPGFLRHEERA